MLIVGERINSSRKPIAEMIRTRDADGLAAEARRQLDAGADYIDLNAGTFLTEEADVLDWMIDVVRSACPAPLCVDSSDPASIERVLPACGQQVMVNSITGERARFEALCPLIVDSGASVVALCIDDSGMPSDAETALRIGGGIIERLCKAGVAPASIYVDPLVQPISTNSRAGLVVLDTIAGLGREYPEVKTICGLSNVSYGLPARAVLNQAFLVATMTAGLDAAIVDPLDQRLMSLLVAADLVRGRDNHCKNYIRAYRARRLT